MASDKPIVLILILGLFAAPAWGARRKQMPNDRWRELRLQLECESALLTGTELEQQLLNLMGEADQKLNPEQYGSKDALLYALKIKVLANRLILTTSTANKLGLEAFGFAHDIEGPSN